MTDKNEKFVMSDKTAVKPLRMGNDQEVGRLIEENWDTLKLICHEMKFNISGCLIFKTELINNCFFT